MKNYKQLRFMSLHHRLRRLGCATSLDMQTRVQTSASPVISSFDSYITDPEWSPSIILKRDNAIYMYLRVVMRTHDV
jgi:hypothetical protein